MVFACIYSKQHCIRRRLYGFSSSQVWIWELDYKESWVPKNWCFWTVVLEKTLESPLNCKEIQPVHPKRDRSWVFIGRTDVEAETPVLWLPDAKNWLTGKNSNAWKDGRQEERGMTENEMVGWHHWLYGHEFEQAPGVGDGQGSLVCCSHGVAELDTVQRLNWTNALKDCELYNQQILVQTHSLESFESRCNPFGYQLKTALTIYVDR